MSRRWARRVERYCCTCATYFPLAFVYGLTSWAAFVIVHLGSSVTTLKYIGPWSSALSFTLYLLLNWSYTTAVFTPPGSTTNYDGYSTLPTHAPPSATSFTVKSNGEHRFCKKCQARKPDRAHHCSTCRRCVLKMDHHCPWLATCIGLRNHKAFLLFLIYTTLFSLSCFVIAGSWVYGELANNNTYVDSLMPINYIILSVVGGIIALVVGAFTAWHISLAARGQTTIECLEKTRYLSPLRKSMQHAYIAQHSGQGVNLPRYGQQLLDMHQNAIPGVTRPEEGEELRSATPTQAIPIRGSSGDSSPEPRQLSYDELERYRARKRYEEYLDEQDSAKLPNAFDLGPRRNLLHLFGPNPYLWAFPVCNTTGDGWAWEPSPKWTEARDRIRRERDEQRERERRAGWGGGGDDSTPAQTPTATATFATQRVEATLGRQYYPPGAAPAKAPSPAGSRKALSKADRVLGRDPSLYADQDPGAVNMRRLSPNGRHLGEGNGDDDDDDDLFDTSSDEERDSRAEAEHKAMNLVTNGGWARSGASGLLRKPSRNNSRSKLSNEDDGVD